MPTPTASRTSSQNLSPTASPRETTGYAHSTTPDNSRSSSSGFRPITTTPISPSHTFFNNTIPRKTTTVINQEKLVEDLKKSEDNVLRDFLLKLYTLRTEVMKLEKFAKKLEKSEDKDLGDWLLKLCTLRIEFMKMEQIESLVIQEINSREDDSEEESGKYEPAKYESVAEEQVNEEYNSLYTSFV